MYISSVENTDIEFMLPTEDIFVFPFYCNLGKGFLNLRFLYFSSLNVTLEQLYDLYFK